MNNASQSLLSFASRPGVIVITAGLPGSGKTTILSNMATSVGANDGFISSESLRRSHGLGDALSGEQRLKLRSLLTETVVDRSNSKNQVIFVDSNLLEPQGRAQIVAAAPPEWLHVFVCPHARYRNLIGRVKSKFGNGYLYPPKIFDAQTVLDHSIDADYVFYREEAEKTFDVVLDIDTDFAEVSFWVAHPELLQFGKELAKIAHASQDILEPLPLASPSYLPLAGRQDAWTWDPERDGLIARLPDRAKTYHVRRNLLANPGFSEHVAPALGDYAESYLGRLRSRWGEGQLIVTSVRVVIFNENRDVCLIKRSDTGRWSLPGGSQELSESIVETACRETIEETGIALSEVELVAITTNTSDISRDAYGNVNQAVVFIFRAYHARDLNATTSSEVADTHFFPISDLPDLEARHQRALESALRFDGRVTLN